MRYVFTGLKRETAEPVKGHVTAPTEPLVIPLLRDVIRHEALLRQACFSQSFRINLALISARDIAASWTGH